MTEIDQLQKKNNRMFILVCLNFTMLVVLFCGLGYVTWRSVVLIENLETKLSNAEAAVAGFQDRIQGMDVDVVMEKVMASATEKLKDSIKNTIQQADFTDSLGDLSEKVEATREKLERTGEAIQEINTKLRNLNGEQIAQAVSYNMLKGLGDGFNQAAESRKAAFEN